MWTTVGNTGNPEDLNPFIIFDLGQGYTLQTTRIWNYNDEGPDPQFGALSILLSASPDGTNFTPFGIINPAEAGNPPLHAQDFVTDVAGVRYVEMQILTNWDSPPAIFWSSITDTNQPGADGRALTGLTKVRFVVAISNTPAPIFSPPSGGYSSPLAVVISCPDTNATIYYSTNAWTTTNVYNGPIQVPTDATGFAIQSYASDTSVTNFPPSELVSASYDTIPVPVWTNTSGGSWAISSNWSKNIIASGVGVGADFSTLILPADTFVTMDTSWTVGGLTFGDVGNTYTWEIDPGSGAALNVLTLDDGTNPPNIAVLNQTATICERYKFRPESSCQRSL
jgi:hypothetical protein